MISKHTIKEENPLKSMKEIIYECQINTTNFSRFVSVYALLREEVPWRTNRFGKSTIPVIKNIINTSYIENYQEKYCNQCKKIFKSGKNLNKHMKVKHSEDPNIPKYTSTVIF